jgi:hypothetical protein
LPLPFFRVPFPFPLFRDEAVVVADFRAEAASLVTAIRCLREFRCDSNAQHRCDIVPPTHKRTGTGVP